MVTSPTGNGVVILGCEGHPEDIYELVNTDGALSWKKMSQKLSYPRSHTISMLLPDNLVNCDFPWFYWKKIISTNALKICTLHFGLKKHINNFGFAMYNILVSLLLIFVLTSVAFQKVNTILVVSVWLFIILSNWGWHIALLSTLARGLNIFTLWQIKKSLFS